METLKLFIVELGEPDSPGWYSMGGSAPIYVIADDYNEAAQKAVEYMKNAPKEKNPRDVLTSDGSINPKYLDVNNEIKIKAIKLASNQVIF